MRYKSIARVCLIAIVLGSAGLVPRHTTQAQEPALTETFDDPALPGWEHTPGASVVDGALRIEPGNSALHRGEWGDLTLTARIRPSSEGDIAIIYRASDAGAYIVVVGVGSVECQREAQGQLVKLGKATVDPIPVGGWARVSVSVSNMDHVIELQGKQVLAVSDPDPLPPGGIAFETVGEAAWDVDDVTVVWAGGPRPPAPQEPIAGLTWVYTGGPIGGLGYDVRIRPRDPEVMFVTDAWAGVFKSTDGGETWFPSNTGITTRVGPSGDGIPVFSLTIDPNNPDRVWIGTQFSNSVFRSDDGGETWVAMNNGILETAPTIRGFTVEPGNSDVVYLAGEISSWEWNVEPLSGLGLDMTKGVVYKTTDGGQNWRRIWYGDNLARYIVIHPEDHDLVYVSTGIFDREAANSDAETKDPGGVGILRSHDGGETWEVLDGRNGFAPDELYIGSLAMHPQNPAVLLAASGNDPYSWHTGRRLGGVYLTEDGGDTWVEVLDDHDFGAVEFCENDPNVTYASAVSGFFRSDDGGHTWRQPGGDLWGPPGIVAGFPIDMQCDPRRADRVFVNSYGGGNFLSEDGGETWKVASTGYTGALMSGVAVARDDSAHVYATARSGVFASRDGGGSWEGLSYGVVRAMEALVVAVAPDDSSRVLTSVGDAGPNPKLSRDGGKTWRDVGIELWEPDRSDRLDGITTHIAFVPARPSTVFATVGNLACVDDVAPMGGECARPEGQGVIVSHDGGETWERTDLVGHAVALAVSSQDAARVYVAISDRSIHRSDDEGATWAMVNQNPLQGFEIPREDPDAPGPTVWSLAVDPGNPDKVYAGLFAGGVFISTDGGETWSPSSAGMDPETSVRAIEVDPGFPDVVYAGTLNSGVYVSTDGGQTWRQINEGLITRAVKALALSDDGDVLYAATEGGGVFRLDLGGEPPSGAPPAVAPGQTPVPTAATEETPTPASPTGEGATVRPDQEGAGGGICSGAAILPLVVGLIWRQRPRAEKRLPWTRRR
jgi:photosystem II stability/assembly factor-like uncharacterized protein